ncbi:OmpA family protein [Methylocapsa palsarum]|uniref:Outer membrane protein OmpA n=1 Tax=Methylocapsa palsarum TaxID=1612308 RepID=A0A1I3ZM76_9HYPH|nr:OmpA family protein [Methylocapsa palsarum]SFK45145.1 Outer membrane protein OmpA [Methylocapsa palsarum]
MALFDNLIADIGSRFNLGSKAESLLRELLRFISDDPNGVAGYLDKFKAAGFGDQIASWLGRGAGPALSSSEVEEALGLSAISAIGRKLSLGTDLVGDAIGYVTPKLVGLLTPGGAIPTRLPASVAGFLGGAEHKIAQVHASPHPVGQKSFDWVFPLALILGLTGLAYFFHQPKEPAAVTEAAKETPAEPAPAPAPVETADPAAHEIAAALTALKPGFSGSELVAILNKYRINFATGSAEIPEGSKPLLLQAAGLIKQLPASSHVQIDGFTDSTGDPAANVVLSQHRADAVRDLLIGAGVKDKILTAKGHGNAEDKGSNRHDRRIEFSVQ